MAKRRAKKTVKITESVPDTNANATQDPKDPQIETQEPQFMDHEIEVERQIAAIRAVRHVEIEHLLTELRLLRSYFNEEQLQKPVLQVFEETLPNLSIFNDEENKKFEVRWKEKGSRLSMSCADGRDVHASLLQRLSMAYPQCCAGIPPLGGFEYSSNAGRTSFLGADNLHIKDIVCCLSSLCTLTNLTHSHTLLITTTHFHMTMYRGLSFVTKRGWNRLRVLEEPSETQTLAMQEALQTPGVTSQRLSVGMTPKTLRLPKPGEMLVSVHGSPLGVFRENNMEAIHESEEA